MLIFQSYNARPNHEEILYSRFPSFDSAFYIKPAIPNNAILDPSTWLNPGYDIHITRDGLLQWLNEKKIIRYNAYTSNVLCIELISMWCMFVCLRFEDLSYMQQSFSATMYFNGSRINVFYPNVDTKNRFYNVEI